MTTVFDLLLAQYGVGARRRRPAGGAGPRGYDDADAPYTPAWQEAITGVPAATRRGSAASSPRTPRSPTVVPNGSLGHRFGETGVGRWNLELGEVDPRLSLLDTGRRDVLVELPRFDTPDGAAADLPRGVPVRRVGGHLVTTVFDLLLAQYGVGRHGLPGRVGRPAYDDATRRTPRPGRRRSPACPPRPRPGSAGSSPRTPRSRTGRSMIVMGAGTNHWFHSDTIYRAFLTLTNLTGCQGVNGGGWAHYVGQEKVRPITGYTQVANALDWNRPPRNMIQTAYWYLHTDQFRYDQFGADTLSATTGKGQLRREVHGRRDRAERPDGLDAVVPDLRPQPARPQRRGRRGGQAGRRVRRRAAQVGRARLRRRGPGRAGELPAGPVDLAGQPARLLGQGQRVLPQAPARHRLLAARDRDAGGPAPAST